MAEMASSERKRLGGDFAIAQAVPTRELRDHIKKVADPDLVFILLILPKQTVVDRLKKRHGDSPMADAITEMCVKLNEYYEPKGENEENTYDVVVSSDMSPDDVAAKIMEILEKL